MSRAVSIASQIMVMAIVISMVLLFAGIAVSVLIHVYIVGRAFKRSLMGANRGERSSDNSIGMSANDLELLPCFDFKAREKGSSLVDCVVCLENFKMGDKGRLLPNCNHSFHAHCIDSWLLKTPFCPICQTGANTHKGACEVLHLGGVAFESWERSPVVVGIPVSSNPSYECTLPLWNR